MNQYDIYLADLNPTIGREQQGRRPVLIISNNCENLLNVVTVIPITFQKEGRKIYPNELSLKSELQLPSILLCQQIRTVSKNRLVKKLTSIENIEMKKSIIEVLCMRFESM